MTALESGDHARAADYFRKVPQHSLLQSSLPALLTLCESGAPSQPAPRTVRALCAWAGEPAIAEPLLLAEPHWRKKQRAKAFSLLKQKIPDLMCWGFRGFNADLTRHLLHAHFLGNYFDPAFDKLVANDRSGKAYTIARATLDRSLFAVNFSEFGSCAHVHFQGALNKLNDMSRVVPISPAMLSRIFTGLAEQYIASAKSDSEDLCSPPNAKKALEHAIKHDPGHLRAWLMLCDLLSMGKDTSAYHRFLDDLTKRFPTEKEVLIRNGDCCVGRGSHTKAIRNFQSAAEIDSVDPRIARGIIRARLGIAEAAYRKRDPSKANWELIETLASSDQSFPEFSIWRLRVRRIILEIRHIKKEEIFVNLATASLPLAPSPFLFEVACRIGFVQSNLSVRPGILDKMFPIRPRPQTLADFLAIIDEVELSEDGDAYNYSMKTALAIFSEHLEQLLEVVDERKDLNALLIRIFSSRIPGLGLASPVIEKWFARTPSDPVLIYLCLTYNFPWLTHKPNEGKFEILEKIADTNDPDNLRLLMLFEKERMRFRPLFSGRDRGEKTPKFDLDYDPHGKGGEYYDDDDDEHWDHHPQDIFKAFDKATANMSSDELLAALDDMFEGAQGDFGKPSRK